MGIHINLDIVPQRITEEKWHKVYQESLKLIEAFPFMDMVKRKKGDCEYVCGTRTKNRTGIFENECFGWHSIGDMDTGSNTEDFIMYDDIRMYMRGNDKSDNGVDILLEQSELGEDRCPFGVRNVFGGKTQGELSHIPLLAIACLLETRLPERSAMVSGDINLAQCRKAVEWANGFLDEPIMLPVICRKEALYERLAAAGLCGEELVGQTLYLTLEAKGPELGSFLREKQADGWYAYFRESLKIYDYDTRGFEDTLKQYLELGGDFEDLCRMLVADPAGKQLSPEKFLEIIIRMKLHVEDKITYDFTRTDRDNADKDNVDGIQVMMQRVFGIFFGLGNHNVNAYIPLEQIKTICETVFGSLCNVEELIDQVMKRQEEEDKKETVQSQLYDGKLEELSQKHEKKVEELAQKYDVKDKDDLDSWKEGCRMEPQLENWLMNLCRQLHEFSGKYFGSFREMNRGDREGFFLRRHQNHLLLSDTTWDQIWDGIMDDEYIESALIVALAS